MTQSEARIEARRRWGPDGDAWHNPFDPDEKFVGVSMTVEGGGWRGCSFASWADAFTDADERASRTTTEETR